MHLGKKNLNLVYLVLTSELVLNPVKDILKQQNWQFSESLSQCVGAAKKACETLITNRMDAVDKKGLHFTSVQKLSCAHIEFCVPFCSHFCSVHPSQRRVQWSWKGGKGQRRTVRIAYDEEQLLYKE